MSTEPGADPNGMREIYDKAAQSYEKYGGALTRIIARHILKELLTAPLTPDSVVIDNATGPGVVATELLYTTPKESWPRTIHATDISPGMIKELEKRGHPEIKAHVMDSQDLSFDDGTFSHSFGLFFIFTVPDPVKAAKEIYRTLKPQGTAYVTTWLTLPWISVVNKAIHKVKPDAPEYEGMLSTDWYTPEKIKDILVSGGFEQSRVRVAHYTAKADPSFNEGNLLFVKDPVVSGPITRDWSEDDKKKLEETLDEDFGARLKEGKPFEMPCWIAVATRGD